MRAASLHMTSVGAPMKDLRFSMLNSLNLKISLVNGDQFAISLEMVIAAYATCTEMSPPKEDFEGRLGLYRL